MIPLHHAGTFLCDLGCWPTVRRGRRRRGPDRGRERSRHGRPRRGVPDRGVAAAPGWNRDRARHRSEGHQAGLIPSTAVLSPDISARTHERLRFRFINGCQRAVVAVKIEGHEVRVMALDSQPAEPFPARDGAMVLAPGGRADVFIDAAGPPGSTSSILLHDGKEARPIARLVASKDPPIRDAPLPAAPPLPSNGLPAQLDLKNALRFDLAPGRPARPIGCARQASRSPPPPPSAPRPAAPSCWPWPTAARRRRLPPPWPSLQSAGPAR